MCSFICVWSVDFYFRLQAVICHHHLFRCSDFMEALQAGFCVLLTCPNYLNTFLLSGTATRPNSYTASALEPAIFLSSSWSLWRMDFRSKHLGTGCVHCPRMSLILSPRWTEMVTMYMCVYIHTY